MKEYWTSFASLLGVLAFCQSLLQIDGVNTNELYNAVQLYLSSSVSINGSRLSLTRALNSSAITFGLSNNDCIVDTFNGVSVLWEHVVTQRQAQTFSWRPLPEEKRGFTLRIRKRDKSLILDSYLDYIMEKASEIRRKNQDRLLYTNSRGGSLDSRGHPWESVPFKHPSTFDTLAMDPVKKQEIMDDLKDFANGQSFYQKAGRAWKRGYLLYGPPGTGKSSMIAAMANHLRRRITKVQARNYYDPEMRCGSGSGPGEDGGNSITLSGLLNFTDGLWSCCGSERIFVFTTNHIEKLDPALLRCGRMDMHIFMSYCSYPALMILLKNYLGYDESDFDAEFSKELAEVVDKAEMTPADISEVLIKNRCSKQKAVSELLGALKTRAERNLKSGNLREKNSDDIMEDEEQEKRALESPPNEGSEFEETCKKQEHMIPLQNPLGGKQLDSTRHMRKVKCYKSGIEHERLGFLLLY
ncbi:putative r2r3-myb transcription factor [Hibiscus syriacus]|uniref:R2r3-myb transcription factor n=1 Tax=Hibiscus syriacus TaxID=106335 RepID=A0A6A3BGD2_HIBSY|nr:putative r2r3-myb transcription factor [Hibiscus syriacus]